MNSARDNEELICTAGHHHADLLEHLKEITPAEDLLYDLAEL